MPVKTTKRKIIPAPRSHHLDVRAASLLEVGDPRDDGDDLLSTLDVARWLGVSYQWLSIGRVRKYGPPYIKVTDRRVAYRRDDVRTWLKSRTFTSTKEYPARGAA